MRPWLHSLLHQAEKLLLYKRGMIYLGEGCSHYHAYSLTAHRSIVPASVVSHNTYCILKSTVEPEVAEQAKDGVISLLASRMVLLLLNPFLKRILPLSFQSLSL